MASKMLEVVSKITRLGIDGITLVLNTTVFLGQGYIHPAIEQVSKKWIMTIRN